jgi:arylsulfatase A-like enzyme
MPSLANLFRQKGFATAAFVSLGILEAQFGLDQGFELYADTFPKDRWYLSAGEVNKRVFPWLDKNKDRHFFLWVHYSDPHEPYAPPYAPLDFKLYLNDRLVCETSLEKYTLNQVTLDLEPGKNELRLEYKNEFDNDPNHFIGKLDTLEFSPAPHQTGLKEDFLHGWYLRQADHVFFIKEKSVMDITNNSGRRRVQLTFRGRPLLSPETARITYRREVEYMDGEIGKLWKKLRELRIFDQTAILLVGDHGEGLGEYGDDRGNLHYGHIHYLYDIYMKVPFIMRAPSLPQKGIIREELVNLVDIAPTITQMMGLKPFPHFQGRNLFRLKKNEPLLMLEETYKPEATKDRFGILSPPWHIIFTPEDRKFEVFNLEKDPRETAALSQPDNLPAELRVLKEKLEAFAREALSGKEEIKIDEKTQEMLRALGYIR